MTETEPNKLKKDEVVQAPQQQVVIPGYMPLCNNCVFRDFYTASKSQNTLVDNLRGQLIAVTQELEKLKKDLSDEETEE